MVRMLFGTAMPSRAVERVMPTELIPFRPEEYLDDPADQAELLAEAIASGDDDFYAHARDVVACARIVRDRQG